MVAGNRLANSSGVDNKMGASNAPGICDGTVQSDEVNQIPQPVTVIEPTVMSDVVDSPRRVTLELSVSTEAVPRACDSPEKGTGQKGEKDIYVNPIEEMALGGASKFSVPEKAPKALLVTCPDCRRSMNHKALQPHSRVCKKVFMTKRKAFKVEVVDSEEMRGVQKVGF